MGRLSAQKEGQSMLREGILFPPWFLSQRPSMRPSSKHDPETVLQRAARGEWRTM